MTIELERGADQTLLTQMLLQHQVERFYYDEAALLDAHRYDEWITLFTEDTHYFMPLRRTMPRRQLHKEFTQPGEMAFFDDDHLMLSLRVQKLSTGTAWAEDPPSRTRHLVTNVRILSDDGAELVSESHFLLHRTRLRDDLDQWVGRREDTLRRDADGFKIARRHVFLDQTVLHSQNLSNFF
ncbi:3-phenylpropionate/cinnamic acid dioxygenase subunit beta [Nocardioides sp. QY071]|uniref:aromatic-ring-hydroxylating dioxygenase subunit beta n=1 Tax=Nocardioides sp. QY071 TaxID=3044187 RepID=UPI00249BB996|nr:3-phenylpropionate/cinnamic acid dioxygenase subunit beta [Nocardioides sp. QY071]WGY00408.1 3-phenylpropionate/cinnamic acid dioxygenase subunit beta [Nocardioides sp. QY071]